MIRTGKIARLPRPVRDELNHRLREGAPGPQLLAWLNEQPEVAAVLAEQFDGRAITAQNLSEWRQGGFADWCRHQDARELAGQAGEEADDFDALADGERLADRFAQATAVALMAQLRAVGAMREGPRKVRATLAVATGLVRLRASDRQWERAGWAGAIHHRDFAAHAQATAHQAAQDKLRGEEVLASYSGDLYRYYNAVRAALAENRVVPAPVLEFLASEAEFERRHAAALRQLDNYREPPYEDYLRNRQPGQDWSVQPTPPAG
ncbi:MAG: hypothetical protein NTV51_10920, partial [Verrucomicrobia bacterium]|nr:hypothetical protein [Verrucomicrobiota bacterium]